MQLAVPSYMLMCVKRHPQIIKTTKYALYHTIIFVKVVTITLCQIVKTCDGGDTFVTCHDNFYLNGTNPGICVLDGNNNYVWATSKQQCIRKATVYYNM